MDCIPDSIKSGTQAQRKEFWEKERDKVFDWWQKHDP